MRPFDFRRKRAVQRQILPTSFTDHSDKSAMRKLTRTSLGTETKLQANICFICDQKGYISDETQPKGLTLHCVTTLNGDEMIKSQGLLTVKTA